jgi:ABC-type transport system substrate-binding protein
VSPIGRIPVETATYHGLYAMFNPVRTRYAPTVHLDRLGRHARARSPGRLGPPRGPRRLALAVVLTLLPGIPAACSSGEGEPPTDTDPQAPPSLERFEEEIAEALRTESLETRLVLAVRRVPDTLDPLGDLDPWGARVAEDLVFQGLTRRTSMGAPWAEPALADVCVARPLAEPRDVYCHLRDDAVFHDGTPVTPADVLYSLDWWLDPRRGTMRLRLHLGSLKKVEMVDGPPGALPAGAARDPGRWAHVSFTHPEPLGLAMLADLWVVPHKAHRGRARAFGLAPIGSGPMKVTAFAADHLVLEPWSPDGAPPATGATEDGGDGDAALPSRIVLREVGDGAAVLTAMRRGDVHVAAELAPAHVPEELAKPGMAPRFRAFVLSPPRYDVLLYNVRSGTQAGPRLRGMLDDAIPRAHLADALGDLPPQDVAAPVDLHDPIEIDLVALYEAGVSARFGLAGLPAARDATLDDAGKARAQATLDALGWVLERGVRRRVTGPLRVVMMWNGAAGDGQILAHGIRDAWRELGIIVPFATASWSYLFGLMRKGEFDVALVRLAERSDADLYPYFHSRGDLNLTGVTDVALDGALEAYRAASTPEERAAARRAVAERLAALRVVSVVRAPTHVMLVSRRVEGLELVDDLPRLDRLRLRPLETWILGQRPASEPR